MSSSIEIARRGRSAPASSPRATPRRARRWTTVAPVLVAALLSARSSFAQSPTREGTAQSLFDEGAELFARGDYDRACEKFRASNELDPKGGTLFNLALCREKQGRTASAWTAFSEARNRSLKEGRPERVAFADKKIAELGTVLPRLQVVVRDDARALEIKVDGDVLPPAAWNVLVPIDPGEHRVSAAAPDRRPVSITVRAEAGKESVTVIPTLALLPIAGRQGASGEQQASTAAWPGWVVMGAGAASLGVGSVFGVQAFSKRSDAESLCAASRCEEGHRANDDAARAAWIANVGIGVGVVALAAGLYLVLRDNPRPAAR